MELKIIGAGFPRTGTTTLKIALEQLGFQKTYHFKDLMANPSVVNYWNELEKTGATNFDALFDGYVATVDFPGYPYYKVLLKKYPDAKVILTKRDFDAWYASTQKTIAKVGPETISSRPELAAKLDTNQRLNDTQECFKFFKNTYIRKQFDDQFDTRSVAEKVFHEHIQSVIDFVPQKQLLVYDVTEGWAPLCAFLSLDIPKTDFPHVNKGENFNDMLEHMLAEAAKG
ncbi:MAG: sulfotransferase family protein [Altibacter sp.]|uniref:sulfotransferase family protein n=1 Tax=Altibacter sp. TaxID=2024823 RepID=UPI001DF06378|nr:sulfotransferase family protein [Altibacter sp.]MBZ0327338.1 sulfotransferase family protein [Altibacter sp.]